MGERKEYGRERTVILPPLTGGRPHRAVVRFNPTHGLVKECCVGYQVWYGGEYVEVVRFDDFHDEFHRHKEGYPEPGEICEWFGHIPMSHRGSFAVGQIREHGEQWAMVLPLEREPQKERFHD